MDEPGLFQADIDKSSLHAREHAHHLALVKVAGDAALPSTFDVDFGQDVVFQQRHPGFLGG